MNKINLQRFFEVLNKSLIFSGMSKEEIEKGIEFFCGKISVYSKGEMLNTVCEPLECFGIVLEGLIHVCMSDYYGQECIMAAVSSGDGFGEALSFLGCDTDVYIRSATDSTILWLSVSNLKNPMFPKDGCDLYIQRFISDLAVRALKMNDRIQIMSKRTLREKLLCLFDIFSSQFESSSFELPFDRNGMAVYLGTDRSSLSRELSKMKAEGIIDFTKNKFKIL